MIIWIHQFGVVAALVGGLIACFAGYRLFRFVLVLLGFVLGAVLAGGLFYTFVEPSNALALIAGILGGALGAFLLGFFYFVGIFIAGAGLGALVGLMAAANFGWQRTLVVLIAAVVCGVLALAMQRLLIVISTAFVGAWAVLAAVAVLAGLAVPNEILRNPPVYWSSPSATFLLVAWVLLGGMGIAAQYRSSSGAPSGGSDRRDRSPQDTR